MPGGSSSNSTMTPESRSTLVAPAVWLEHELVGIREGVHFPVPDSQRILRRASKRLAGDYIFMGRGLRAGLDPDLPVGIGTTKREVLALNAVDDSQTDVLAL